MTQVDAVNATIAALPLRPEHAALSEAARRLAETLDIDENAGNASLWMRYQEAIIALLDAVPHEAEDDGSATLLELVRPKIRNPKNARAKDAGAGGGRARSATRNSVDAVAATGRRRRPGTAS